MFCMCCVSSSYQTKKEYISTLTNDELGWGMHPRKFHISISDTCRIGLLMTCCIGKFLWGTPDTPSPHVIDPILMVHTSPSDGNFLILKSCICP